MVVELPVCGVLSPKFWGRVLFVGVIVYVPVYARVGVGRVGLVFYLSLLLPLFPGVFILVLLSYG